MTGLVESLAFPQNTSLVVELRETSLDRGPNCGEIPCYNLVGSQCGVAEVALESNSFSSPSVPALALCSLDQSTTSAQFPGNSLHVRFRELFAVPNKRSACPLHSGAPFHTARGPFRYRVSSRKANGNRNRLAESSGLLSGARMGSSCGSGKAVAGLRASQRFPCNRTFGIPRLRSSSSGADSC
jgi:hypothetical protein